MEHIQNSTAPEASTDERASSLDPQPETEAPANDDWPDFATRAEAMAFWQGVRRGIRTCRKASRDLTRDGAAPSLTSAKLLDPWPHIPDEC